MLTTWMLVKVKVAPDGSPIGPLPNIVHGVPTSSSLYDCAAGYSHWHNGWSIGKKIWCCQTFRISCPTMLLAGSGRGTSSPAAATSAAIALPTSGVSGNIIILTTSVHIYDCDNGYGMWRTAWSAAKCAWCCDHFKRGCRTSSVPYDCHAGLANAAMGWSMRKKQWCCIHHGQGCSTTSTAEAFDCDAGYKSWQAGWAATKMDWCCRHFARGCPHDCAVGFAARSTSWTAAKKAWCCREEGLDCPKV